MTCASVAEPRSFAYGRFCAFSACSSASRPFCSWSSRVSRENHWRILLRARELFASESQERDDAPVDLRADRAMADVGVDCVREVDRRGPGRQRLHLALRREDVHLLVEEVGAELLHELARVRLVV